MAASMHGEKSFPIRIMFEPKYVSVHAQLRLPPSVRLHPSIQTPLGRTMQAQGRAVTKASLMYPSACRVDAGRG